MRTKTELMQAVFAGLATECCTFVPDDGTPERIYNVTELRARLYNPMHIPRAVGERMTVAIGDVAPFLRTNRVWEEERVKNLKPSDLEDPAIALQQPDGSMVFVDGTHRIIRQERDGAETVEIMVVPDHWCPCIDPSLRAAVREDWGAPLDSLRS